MCGIAGIIDFKKISSYEEEMRSILKRIHHRGPDESNFINLNSATLGHVRLSIVDIEGGKQPFCNSDNSIGLVFNGEIYGFKDLKKSFSNYPFKTSSDTELLLAMYQRDGLDFVKSLPGMFAFAFWNDKKKVLEGARDPFGEKPFYYAFGKEGQFVFCSEIKGILSSGLVDESIDRKTLAHYLKFGYSPAGSTIYRNIKSIPAGYSFQLTKDGLELKKYFELSTDRKESITINDAIDEFHNKLDQSIEKQLVADVEIGAFLSGGLDSSTIVAKASKLYKGINTYSVGFGEKDDELPYAKMVADRCKTNHTEIIIKDFNTTELIEKMSDVYDEPFSDSSSIPTYLVAQEASKHQKVVLTGDGADELLGGYFNWYIRSYMASYRSPTQLNHNVNRLRLKLNPGRLSEDKALSNSFQAYKDRKDYNNVLDLHHDLKQHFTDQEIQVLMLSDEKPEYESMPGFNLNDVLRYDIKNYMCLDVLKKTDRSSMQHSLELRAPFLDHDFASFCIGLPHKLKMNEKENKVLLRRAMKNDLPETLFSLPKRGFNSPIRKWLADKSFEDFLNSYLKDPELKIFKFLDYHKCQFFVEQKNIKTWSLLNLSIWLERNKL